MRRLHLAALQTHRHASSTASRTHSNNDNGDNDSNNVEGTRLRRAAQAEGEGEEGGAPRGTWLAVEGISFAGDREATVMKALTNQARALGLGAADVRVVPKHNNFAQRAMHLADASFCLMSDEVKRMWWWW